MDRMNLPLRQTMYFICFGVSAVCLIMLFVLTSQWVLTVLAAFVSAVWFWAKKHPETWLPHLCLLASISLAVTGLLLGSASFLAVISAAASLAAWDLLLFNSALGENTSGEHTRRFIKHHLQALGLSIGFGTATALLGHFLQVKIPFIGLVILIILLYLGLDRIWIFIKDRRG